MRIATGLAATAASLLLLAGCADEAQQIASDACNLFEEAFADDADMEALMGLQQEMQDLTERADDADVSDEDLQTAIREECPDLMDTLEGFGS